MISPSEILNHISNKSQCENHIPYRVEQMFNKLNSNYNTTQHNSLLKSNLQNSHPTITNTQNYSMSTNIKNSTMKNSNIQHPILTNNNTQNPTIIKNIQHPILMKNIQDPILMNNNLKNSVKTNSTQNHGLMLGEKYNEQADTHTKEEKMDETTKLLNNFIKNNNLSLEEQRDLQNELKKINNILPSDKKIVISFEKNKFKIQILDSGTEQIEKIKLPYKKQNQENIPEVTTYNFNTNLWYISLSSVVLTFLIIVLLLIKWKDSS